MTFCLVSFAVDRLDRMNLGKTVLKEMSTEQIPQPSVCSAKRVTLLKMSNLTLIHLVVRTLSSRQIPSVSLEYRRMPLLFATNSLVQLTRPPLVVRPAHIPCKCPTVLPTRSRSGAPAYDRAKHGP